MCCMAVIKTAATASEIKIRIERKYVAKKSGALTKNFSDKTLTTTHATNQ